ncbi:VOC family protein [Pyruvatibacter mobilis]|uniref:VOC family protein n=1 Tax=Pyruvatibacter mobilis TaxID=1712261 RepID=UPI003BAFB8E9
MKLNQVTVGATDIPRAIEFYTRLGMTLIVEDGHYARFEMPAGDTFSVHQADTISGATTVVYFEFADVDTAVKDAEARGITFETQPEDQSWLWREAYLSDPDGNRICFLQESPNRRFPPWRVDGRTA